MRLGARLPMMKGCWVSRAESPTDAAFRPDQSLSSPSCETPYPPWSVLAPTQGQCPCRQDPSHPLPPSTPPRPLASLLSLQCAQPIWGCRRQALYLCPEGVRTTTIYSSSFQSQRLAVSGAFKIHSARSHRCSGHRGYEMLSISAPTLGHPSSIASFSPG